MPLSQLIPLTLEYCQRSTPFYPSKQEVKFTSCDLRIQLLGRAILIPIAIIFTPFLSAYYCFKKYKLQKSNPLDVLVIMIVSPLITVMVGIRYLAGAIIHPGIAYKAETSPEIPPQKSHYLEIN